MKGGILGSRSFLENPVVGVISVCLWLGPGIEMLLSLSLAFALSNSLSSLLEN